MGQKLGEGGCAFFLGAAGSPSNTVALDEAYLHTKWHLSPSSRLATTDISRKLGGCAPLGEGELGPHPTQCRVGRRLPLYNMASWSMQLFGHNRREPKIGGSAPFWGGGLSPYLTQSRLRWGLPPYQVASWCIQPFGHNKNGPKIGGGSAPFWEGELGPHLTQWRLGRGLPPY